MGKKQTRVNKGARTGGHEHRTPPAETRSSTQSAMPEAPRPAIDVPSHRKERKFGHN
ncbi:hypothetical protein KV205_28975 [Streptomyces sp. SKN60]|uniref:hypothetical protein n=1 Tax=Streptomyces sp. SKN60 TaxID=2855506 RepID=UPI0022481D8D|nr:hypothetical protein [Streptomyces sp. SKN60]MCX2184535.1 hypothetical protein [Streptomyces sp. SKN60]